jgi:hypothetical protein
VFKIPTRVVFFVLIAWMIPARSGDAGTLHCNHCYEITYPTSAGQWTDAQCCDPDYYWDCANYSGQGWILVERYVGCNYRTFPRGTRCDGDSHCDDYWGTGEGEGSGACVIASGEMCPAECQRCQIQI